MGEPVCLVTGVGPDGVTGAQIARRSANGGYRVAKPAAIAEEMYRVAHQNRSAWSFTVELRPFGEVW